MTKGKIELLSQKYKSRKSRRSMVITILVLLIAVAVVGLIILRMQFNESYANASAALEQRQLNIIATYRAENPP